MRTLTELYKIVLEFYLKDVIGGMNLNTSGICAVFHFCHNENLMTFEEKIKLKNHFKSQRTKNHYIDTFDSYWFKPCVAQPRIELLQSLIKKTNRK